MKFFAILVGLSLAAPAMAAGYRIDPLASVPYVRQQLAPEASGAAIYRIASFAVANPDAGCAAYGWTFQALGQRLVGDVATPTNGKLNLWLAMTIDGRCVWTTTKTVSDGMVFDIGTLDGYIAAGIVPVATAEALAQRASSAPLTIRYVELSAAGGPRPPGASGHPSYFVSGDAAGVEVTYLVDAVTGVVTPGQGTNAE